MTIGSGPRCDRGVKIFVCSFTPSRVGIITSLTSNRSAALGWLEDEYTAVNVPWKGRGARLDETLDVLEKIWFSDVIEHNGELFTIPPTKILPKPKLGADSIGLTFVTRDGLDDLRFDNLLVQPRIRFRYEVSFYFVDRTFQYALYAPRPDRRWCLERYESSAADLDFAQRFVDWNTVDRGIQRVDACRTPKGELLLVELEDLNPYLSLDLLDSTTRDAFVSGVKISLQGLLGDARP